MKLDLKTLAGIIKATDEILDNTPMSATQFEKAMQNRVNVGALLTAISKLESHVHALKNVHFEIAK